MPGQKKQYHCFNFFKLRLLDYLSDGKPRTCKDIAIKLGVSQNDVSSFMSRNMKQSKRLVKRLKLKDKTGVRWQNRYSISKHGFVMYKKYMVRFRAQQTLNLNKDFKKVPTYINVTKEAKEQGLTLKKACENFNLLYSLAYIPALAKNQNQISDQKKTEQQ